MKRKVIQIADSTQLISLPRKWCQEHGIRKGDELEVEEQGNKILVSTSKEETLETAQIHFSSLDSFLARPLITFYRLGYDQVNISFDDPQVIHNVQGELAQLMGFEIVNQTERSCVVRNVASALDKEFDGILRRIMLMLIEMAKDSAAAVTKKNLAALEELGKRERLNNKLTLFCERILNKKGYKDHKRQSFVYYIVCNLEHIADNIADICNYVRNKPSVRLGQQTMRLMRDTTQLIEQVYAMFYKFTIEELFSFKKAHLAVEKQGRAMLATAHKDEVPVVHYLLMIIEKLRNMSAYCIS